MSIEAEPIEHQRELETDNDKIISLLKGILVGIAVITGNLTPEELIALGKGL